MSLFLTLLFSLLTLMLPAQVKLSDHLSNPNITCFEEDTHGRIWIGTSYGLNRYNGDDFHQFFGDALPGNYIEDILCDSKGRIWVGTDNGVVSFSDSEGFLRYDIKSEMKKVNQILEDKDGRIFLNMTEDLCVLDTARRIFVPAVEFFDRYYQYHQMVYIGADSLMWVVSAAEIRCFDTSDMSNLDNMPTPEPALLSELFPSGKILFGGGKSLFLYDTGSYECRALQLHLSAEVSMIVRVSDHEAVIKTVDGQLLLYDVLNGNSHPWNLDVDHRFNLTTVFLDSKGNIWLGSSEDGFEIRRSSPDRFNNDTRLVKSFENHSVLSVDTDSDGNVWAFTGNGIIVYDTQKAESKKIIPMGLGNINENDMLQDSPPTLTVDSHDRVWFSYPNQRCFYEGHWDGTHLHAVRKFNAYYPQRFTESEDGSVWCGLKNEFVARIEKDSLRLFQVFSWSNSEIRDILSCGQNLLVASYNNHLALLNSEDFSISHLPVRENSERSVSREGVFDPSVMKQDGDCIWIGTRNSGLLKYSNSSYSLKRMDGIPDCVCAIEKSGDSGLWVSTPDGLFLLNLDSGYIQTFSANEGIGGNCFYEGSSCSMADGTVLFGGTHGITQINPDWKASQLAGRFTFEDIGLGNDRIIDISGMTDIVLSHNENRFSISFVNISQDNDNRQDYSYMLEGYDKDWINSGNGRTAYYSNLDPGRYEFKVVAKGVTNSFGITIKPHFLLTWWMELLYFVIAAGFVFWVLRSRQKILESRHTAKVNEMNMRFFINISHEFRTPLTMISGPAEQLAQDETLNCGQKDLVGVMQGSINRMLTLVNQLLELGKIENDTLKLQVSNIDIIPAVKLICKPFRREFEAHGGTFNLVLQCSSAYAMTDEDKLQKILTNLLSNAVKYTPAGGVITVSVNQDGKDVAISVSDNGPGVPSDKIERIFERYYHLGKDSKYSTGIGLYYARSLAKVHHGSLQAENRPEGGMVFTYHYPYNAAAYAEDEIKLDRIDSAGPVETVPGLVDMSPASDDNRAVVLVIDDDRDLLSYINSLLGSKYRVMMSDNADDALEMARKEAPDVILSDVMMPGKSGLELCREIKEDMVLSHVPVILVTAKGAVDSQVEGLEQGADAYVTKPFAPSYLLALVKTQIDKHQKIRQLINSSAGLDSLDTSGLSSKDAAFLREIYSCMDGILDKEGVDVAELAEQMGVSRSKFYYKIKALTGKTPSEFLTQYRLNVAAKLLKEGSKNVSEVAFAVGFSTLPHFSKCFKKQFGVSPSKYA